MFNHVPIKHKQMSLVSNGGKFKLYRVSKVLPPVRLLKINKNYETLERFEWWEMI
jgi:hypothetical protein